MKRYFLHLAYNGARYHGWQIQPGAISIQEELEKCLSLKLGEKVSLTGCGRTDTGVHARNCYAHFDVEKPINNCEELVRRLNIFLPNDIVIYKHKSQNNYYVSTFKTGGCKSITDKIFRLTYGKQYKLLMYNNNIIFETYETQTMFENLLN